MTNFEDILQQYEPMISASIRKLNIYRDHDSFIQAGRIALWQAWNRFDAAKGNFTAFAYRSIRGAMLDEMKKENKFEEHVMRMEDKSLGNLIESKSNDRTLNGLAEVMETLSSAEQELVQWLFIDGFTLSECAERVGITVAGIKKRRQRILEKLRSNVL